MSREEHTYYVYMGASRSHVLYCGVTNNLPRRIEQHREAIIEGFAADYKCTRLVWFERFRSVNNAIAREKQIKRWRREKKVALIRQANPTWLDLREAWKDTAGPSTSLRFGRDDTLEERRGAANPRNDPTEMSSGPDDPAGSGSRR